MQLHPQRILKEENKKVRKREKDERKKGKEGIIKNYDKSHPYLDIWGANKLWGRGGGG